MAKSKKKRIREAMVAATSVSPNGVESDVTSSAAAAATAPAPAGTKSPSSSTPIKNGSSATTSTPIQKDGNNSSSTPNNNDNDPSTWTKSKKRRMKAKRRKEANAAKKLQMSSDSGSGETSSGSVTAGTSSPVNGAKVVNATSPTKPSKANGVSNNDDDGGGNSNKRLRKSPDVARNKKACEGLKNQSVADAQSSSSPKKKKKKTSTTQPTTLANDEDGAQKKSSPTMSKQNNTEESTTCKSSEANETPADNSGSSSSPKKKKKKKKKSNASQTTAEEAQKSPSKGTNNTLTPSNNKPTTTTSPKNPKITLPKPSQMSTLQKSFLERLTSSRFRELNEELYTHSSQHSFESFSANPELFDQYHVGFRKQVREWPVNPVDVIYRKIVKDYHSSGDGGKKKIEKGGEEGNDGNEGQKGVVGKQKQQVVVADFGCGDAKLAERLLALTLGKDGHTLTQASSKTTKKKKGQQQSSSAACPFKVHSFDLVSGGNALVTPADMCNVPLPKESIDVGVYSLALMGTNVADFVREAWRVLKFNGVLRVAEVRSRFETAAENDNDTTKGGGGGKRGKLNNGKKNKMKNNHNKKGNNSNDNSNNNDSTTPPPPQPLMLIDEFISLMERCGFDCTNMDTKSNKMFLFMDFVKVDGSRGLSSKERFSAKPCMYKRR